MKQRDRQILLVSKPRATYRPFWHLTGREQLVVGWTIFRLQAQLIFSHRLAWFLGGILVYFVVVYLVNYRQPIVDRITQGGIFSALLELPLSVLAMYLNMQVITGEKENRTLEVMFTTAGSRYRVWLLRLGTLNMMLLVFALGLSILSFFTMADVPVLGAALNAFVPTFFVGNLTLYFAVRLRSGLGAGMVAGGLVILHLLFSSLYNETRYFLYFNPYRLPRQLDPLTWNLWLWQNRIGVFLLGGLLLFFALRAMEVRERLLR